MDVRTVPDLLRHALEVHRKPDAFLVKREGLWVPVSIDSFANQVRARAADLTRRGVVRGDRVAIFSENRIDWAVADQAVLSIGAVCVPIYATLPADHVGPLLADCGAVGAFVSSEAQRAKVESVRPQTPGLKWVVSFDVDGAPQAGSPAAPAATPPGPDDLATIIYTSGTTGVPKGVMLTHGNLVSNALASLTALDLGPTDVHLSFLPLNHIFERTAGYNVMVYAGATIAYAESIEKAAANLMEVRPTLLLAVPRFYEKLIDRIMEVAKAAGFPRDVMAVWGRNVAQKWAALKLGGRPIPPGIALQHALANVLVYPVLRRRLGGRIRYCFSGGAALPREIGLFFYGVGMPVMEGYGLTETSPVIAVNTEKRYKLGTVGCPIPGVDVRIAEDGEILVRGPSVMKGYWNRSEETATALEGGWFHTGDIGEIDADGFLRITDRKKDLIVTSGGKKIAPQPIQNALKKSPRILEAIVVGDGRKYATALIVAANGATREAIAADVDSVNKTLASYETIKRFELIPNDLTVENGSLSQKLEVKRRVISDRYRDLIEKMYHGEE
ncbi:MAG TPA: long-chain fatty acid--CoA ligase [Candidatus Eisenbacteria bacterium]